MGLHPKAPRPRALHERLLELGEPGRVAIIRVETVGVGRLLLAGERVLVGELREADGSGGFPVKRSPLAPPPLEVGDRALLMLRGDRPPYVLADRPGEVIRLVDPEMEQRWASAIQQTWQHRQDPPGLADLYPRWVAEGPGSLRELALAGVQALCETEAAACQQATRPLARLAADPGIPGEVRRAAARLVIQDAEASAELGEALLAGSAGQGGGPLVDGPVAEMALRAGALHHTRTLRSLFIAALGSASPDVRSAALRTATPVVTALDEDPALVASIARVATADEDPIVQRFATRALLELRARGIATPEDGARY
jgi:hypothetical protein